MDSLRSSLGQNDFLNLGCWDFIFSGDVSCNVLSNRLNTQGVSVTSSTDNLIKNAFCTISGVNVDLIIIEEIRINDARNDFSEESNRLLVEFLRVTNIAESYLIERIICVL
jgi:hypothetical protein